jgi:hypothetical protein
VVNLLIGSRSSGFAGPAGLLTDQVFGTDWSSWESAARVLRFSGTVYFSFSLTRWGRSRLLLDGFNRMMRPPLVTVISLISSRM